MRKTAVLLGLLIVFGIPRASHGRDLNEFVRVQNRYPIDWYFTPADNPCLTETIHVTGILDERLQIVVNSTTQFSYVLTQSTRDMTAEGMTTGETYRGSSPLSLSITGTIPEPGSPMPLSFTFHNINHFVGPGQLPNLYFRTLSHIRFDPVTREMKVQVSRDNVLCSE